jgi:toxoflavin synthase
MTTNYDPIAEQYKRSKQQPWRAHVKAFTLLKLIGDPADKVVIDIACGDGFYTRMIRQRGAAKVTGVDLSEKMIELARASEAEQRLGIDYIVGDGRNLGLAADYDLAVAAYFLNYAHDRAELNAMCGGVARCLKPGGRFVTVNGNPACDFPSAPSYRTYGFDTRVVGSFREGAPITWTFHLRMVHSTSRTIFLIPRLMRRRCAPPDFARSVGTGHYCRRRAAWPTGGTIGRICWTTHH